MTNKDFIEKVKEKFNGQIEPLQEYQSIRKTPKILFKCKNPDHPDFEMRTEYVFREKAKYGCPICAGNQFSYTPAKAQKKLDELFNGNIKLISKWEINKTTIYKDLIFECSTHGLFTEKYNNVIRYKLGCSKCAYNAANKKKHQKPINDLKKKLENTGIFFNEEDYVNVNTPIIFYLQDGQSFKRSPGKILYENKISINKRSNGETHIAKILKELNEDFEEEKTFNDLKFINNLFIDFFLEKRKIFIEYDGMQHLNESSKFFDPIQIKRDQIKNNYAQDNGFRILRFFKKNNHSLTDNQINTIKLKIQEFFLSSTTIETLEI